MAHFHLNICKEEAEKKNGTITNLENLNRPRKEVHHLVALIIIITIAAWRQCINARAVLAPLVLPEALGGPAVRQPERAHVLEQLSLSRALEDGGDAVVGRGVVTALRRGTITQVGPEDRELVSGGVAYGTRLRVVDIGV